MDSNFLNIGKYNQILGNRLRNTVIKPAEFQLINSASGAVNLLYKNIPLHDNNNPQEESLKALAQVKDADIIVLIGIGLGYTFKMAYEHIRSKIVIYEPDINLLKFTLSSVDFSKELSDERVRVTNTYDELLEALSNMYSHQDNIQFCFLNSSQVLYKEQIEYISQESQNILSLLHSNFVTMFASSKHWLTYNLANVNFLEDCSRIESMTDKLKNKAAIIVSPGPSLAKTIQYIKMNREKVIIFCANSALKVLKKNEINPDFVIMVDYYDDITNQLVEEDNSETTLIALSSVRTTIWKGNYKNKLIYLSKNDLFARWLSQKYGINTEHQPKGTVSYLGLLSAQIMGCNPIIMTGQDLALNGNKHYCDEINKTNEIFKDVLTTKGQNGETVNTRSDFLTFIKYFEQFAIEHSDIKLINCSPGGAQINGFENVDIKEMLEGLNENISNVQDIVSSNSKVSVLDNRATEIIGEINKSYQDIIKMHSSIDNALGVIKKLEFEFKRKNLDLNKINSYLKIVLSSYDKIQQSIFDEYLFTHALCWKEELELIRVLDDKYEITLNHLMLITEKAKHFFLLFKWNFGFVYNTKNRMESAYKDSEKVTV